MIGRTNAGGGGAGAYAFIVADWPADSTCQAVRSSDGKTLRAKGTTGHFVFKLPKPITAGVAETWTVSCTDGTDTASATVTVTTEGQSESVALSYALYLIKDGILLRQFDYLRSGTTVTQQSDNVLMSGTSGYALFAYVAINDGIEYSQLVLETSSVGYSYVVGDSPGIGYSDSVPTLNASARTVSPKTESIVIENSPTIPVGTFTCQVHGTATKYIWIAISGASGTSGTLHIKNLYLSR